MVPEPDPDTGGVMVIHGLEVAAVQLHAGDVVMVKLPLPPASPRGAEVGDSV